MTTQLLIGDVRKALARLPAESVHCVVTSPPYWGLRDYGTATWEGGDSEHEHTVGGQVQDSKWAGAITTGQRPGAPNVCRGCGAIRQDNQLGLEPTPEQYVANMVAVFREVRRVLRNDGTLWLNLGDSYANDGKWGGSSGGKHVEALHGPTGIGRQKSTTGLKPKDLVGIPWRVAFALQADGWWLRSDIIWSKPNPMPESVTDRPTKSHEYLFLLTKSARYYYDNIASAEPAQTTGRWPGIGPAHAEVRDRDEEYVNMTTRPTRNRRDVWTIPTKPFKGAHFAVFPPALVEPCLLAGCPVGGTVLDPFAGSGTVGMVAKSMGRDSILVELNREYVPLIEQRLKSVKWPTPALHVVEEVA